MLNKTLSAGVLEFIEHKKAQRLSPKTLVDYIGILQKFENKIGKEREIKEITAREVRQYLMSLPVSKKRVKNVYITLSSFWTWAVREDICETSIMKLVEAPKPEKRVVLPFERHEVETMIRATELSLPYTRPGKRTCSHSLPVVTSHRDRSIMLLLVDTGIRASELCGIKVEDIGSGGIYIRGKGSKDRIVPISESTRTSMDIYLAMKTVNEKSFVFTAQKGRALTPDTLGGIICRTAKRAGVLKAFPHRFRHTFAINFLKNGGDPFSLQMILGHSTLDMVKRYLYIAKSDIVAAHRVASPVRGWELDLLAMMTKQ